MTAFQLFQITKVKPLQITKLSNNQNPDILGTDKANLNICDSPIACLIRTFCFSAFRDCPSEFVILFLQGYMKANVNFFVVLFQDEK